MQNYELEMKDFEQIRILIKVSNSIQSLYNRLYNLEMSRKKDTAEYKKLLEHLNIAVEVENSIYEELDLYPSKCIALIKYLLNERLPIISDSIINNIMNENDKNNNIRRILNTLKYKLMADNSLKLDAEALELVNFLGITDIKKSSYFSSEYIKIIGDFDKNIIRAITVLLQERIGNSKYEKLANMLINTKYNISYIYKYLEPEMISNNFDMKSIQKTNVGGLDKTAYINMYLYKNLKDSYLYKISLEQVKEILKYKDDSNRTLILRYFLLRTTLLFMGDKSVMNIKNLFNDLVEFKKEANIPINESGKTLIDNCFEYKLNNKEGLKKYSK